jgi:hypothetical protein
MRRAQPQVQESLIRQPMKVFELSLTQDHTVVA